MTSILVGTAEKNIYLPLGLDLTGYIVRKNSGAKGTNDELKVKCLVIRNGNEIIGLVSCELLGLSNIFVKEVIESAVNCVSIPQDNIIISCTHTHSGPASVFIQGCGQENNDWKQSLKLTIVECIYNAAQNLKPSYITYKTGYSCIGYNRIGHSLFNDTEKKAGNTDDQVGVLTVHDIVDYKATMVIVNYACHPVVLTADNMLYSADYPHYMEEYLRRNLIDAPDIMFVNGCCGDIDPIKRGGFELAKEVGEELGKSILNITETGYSTKEDINPVLSIKSHVVKIPIQHVLDETKVLNLLEEFKRDLEEESAQGNNDFKLKVCMAYINWAERMLEKIKTGTLEHEVEAEIKLIRIGKINIVTLPFEIYHDTGLKIKSQFGLDHTIVIGYANGNHGYLASKEQFSKSKYEMQEAFRYYGYPGPFSEDSEMLILEQILQEA